MAEENVEFKALVRRILPELPELIRNREVVKALDSILFKRRGNYKRQDLRLVLARLALFAVKCRAKKSKARRNEWERLFASDTGKDWDSLRLFPQKLRQMADEVERIHASASFGPEVEGIDPQGDVLKPSIELPDLLRWESKYIESLTAEGDSVIARFCQPKGRLNSGFVVQLSLFVKEITGKYNDPLVADLLNRMAKVLDFIECGSDEAWITAENMMVIRSRSPKGPRTPIEEVLR